MGKKGVAPRITRMKKTEVKVQPIPRDRDNTDDLEEAELRVHSKASPFPHPGNKGRKGSFDSGSNAAFNGNQISAP